jgi:hypothetical protein
VLIVALRSPITGSQRSALDDHAIDEGLDERIKSGAVTRGVDRLEVERCVLPFEWVASVCGSVSPVAFHHESVIR